MNLKNYNRSSKIKIINEELKAICYYCDSIHCLCDNDDNSDCPCCRYSLEDILADESLNLFGSEMNLPREKILRILQNKQLKSKYLILS